MRCSRLIVPLTWVTSTSRCTCQNRFSSSSTTSNTDSRSPPSPSTPETEAAAQQNEPSANAAESRTEGTTPNTDSTRTDASTPPATTPAAGEGVSGDDDLAVAEPEPLRWVQEAYLDPDKAPIVDEKGEYIVSKGNWPTGEVAYSTPAPVDDKLAPRFGYNVVSVRKHVSWWKYNQKYPSFSLAYVNIQVLFILGIAWLCAFLTEEYRRATDEMKTPGAMVGEHRGRGPETSKTQKISFSTREMGDLVNRAQDNWMDGKAEASYIGSKEYQMRKIGRPKEFSVDDFRKR